MLKDVVECEDCGRVGSKEEIGVCGFWIGTPEKGYACPDIMCKGHCIGEEDGE